MTKLRFKTFAVRVLAAIGALAIVGTVVAVVVCMTMIRHGFGARDEPSSVEKHVAQFMRRASVPSSTKALANPVPATDAVLSGARAHWADHCALCHGNDGKGDTQIGRNLYPRVPDMTAPDTQEQTDGELFYVIENGVRLSGMPAWKAAGDHDDGSSWALVGFIRHLPKIGAEELRLMDSLNPKGPEDRAEDKFLRSGGSPARHGNE